MSLKKLILEKILFSNYQNYAKAVTEAYDARTEYEKDVIPSYRALNVHNHKMHKRLLSKIKIEYVPVGETYESASEMAKEVKRTGILKVSNLYSDNLISGWEKEDNLIFRAVHDYIVHIGGNVDFSQRGEIQAFNVHAKLVPPIALDALFGEVVAQACFYTIRGYFIEVQKACKLYGFNYQRLGDIDWDEYRLNFTKEPIRPYSENEIDKIIEKVKQT